MNLTDVLTAEKKNCNLVALIPISWIQTKQGITFALSGPQRSSPYVALLITEPTKHSEFDTEHADSHVIFTHSWCNFKWSEFACQKAEYRKPSLLQTVPFPLTFRLLCRPLCWWVFYIQSQISVSHRKISRITPNLSDPRTLDGGWSSVNTGDQTVYSLQKTEITHCLRPTTFLPQ